VAQIQEKSLRNFDFESQVVAGQGDAATNISDKSSTMAIGRSGTQADEPENRIARFVNYVFRG
jgi:hypothetical protein